MATGQTSLIFRRPRHVMKPRLASWKLVCSYMTRLACDKQNFDLLYFWIGSDRKRFSWTMSQSGDRLKQLEEIEKVCPFFVFMYFFQICRFRVIRDIFWGKQERGHSKKRKAYFFLSTLIKSLHWVKPPTIFSPLRCRFSSWKLSPKKPEIQTNIRCLNMAALGPYYF